MHAGREPVDASAALTAALRELFHDKTQAAIAAELSERGLRTDQTKVSAWTRGRQPSLDQLSIIEEWAGKPKGWVLARAGYVDLPGIDAIETTPADGRGSLQEQIDALAERVARLERRRSAAERG